MEFFVCITLIIHTFIHTSFLVLILSSHLVPFHRPLPLPLLPSPSSGPQVPSFAVLALRCLLLPALLRPQATGAAALAELLQQQLLPVTRDLEQALVHDVGLLRAVRGLGCAGARSVAVVG